MTGVPARTLFVAQSWSPGVDPMVFFTTINAALAQAATMTPASGNPVAVIIFPGTYPEDIEIPSWVFLSSGSTEQNAVTINGTVTWTPTGATMEVVQLYFLNIGPHHRYDDWKDGWTDDFYSPWLLRQWSYGERTIRRRSRSHARPRPRCDLCARPERVHAQLVSIRVACRSPQRHDVQRSLPLPDHREYYDSQPCSRGLVR